MWHVRPSLKATKANRNGFCFTQSSKAWGDLGIVRIPYAIRVRSSSDVLWYHPWSQQIGGGTLQAPNLIRTEKCVIWYLSYQVNGTNILPGSRYWAYIELGKWRPCRILHRESKGNNEGHFALEIEVLRDQGSLDGWKYNIQHILFW